MYSSKLHHSIYTMRNFVSVFELKFKVNCICLNFPNYVIMSIYDRNFLSCNVITGALSEVTHWMMYKMCQPARYKGR